MANESKFFIREENIMIYELESNDRFNINALSESEQKAINEHNINFEKTTLQETLFNKARPCQCLLSEIQERAIRKSSIITPHTNDPRQVGLEIVTQDDIDQMDFMVILNEDDGYYKDIRCIISHCKRCGELHMWGDLAPIADLVARAFVDYDTANFKPANINPQLSQLMDGPKPDDGKPQFILENTVTGEVTPADDLVRNMTNQGSVTEDMDTNKVDE